MKLVVDMDESLAKRVYMDVLNRNRNVRDMLDEIAAYDMYTLEHSDRVFQYAIATAFQQELDYEEVIDIGVAALLHDYGKIYISKDILNKPDKLNEFEYCEMQKHVLLGYCAMSEKGFSQKVLRYISEHHERGDGSGYPFGKDGLQVSDGGRILAVCDIYDALTVKRVYQSKPMKRKDVINLLVDAKGVDLLSVAGLNKVAKRY